MSIFLRVTFSARVIVYFISLGERRRDRVKTFRGFLEEHEGNKFRSLLELEMDEISYADGWDGGAT